MSEKSAKKINKEIDEFIVQSIEKFEHDVLITLDEKEKSIFKVGFMYGIRFGILHKKDWGMKT